MLLVLLLICAASAVITLALYVRRGTRAQFDSAYKGAAPQRAARLRRHDRLQADEEEEAVAVAPGAPRNRRLRARRPLPSGSDTDSESGDDDDEELPSLEVSAYELARRQRDAERDAQERAEEQELARLQEARARQEQEEFDSWKDSFTVDAAGTDTLTSHEATARKQQLCELLREKKMVQLDEVSATFAMRTKDVIDLIHDLERSGELSGIMDDRGKYIYISPSDMRRIADFIMDKGRLAISDLAKDAGRLLHLDDMHKAASPAQTLDALEGLQGPNL